MANPFEKYAQPQGAVFQTNPNEGRDQAREDERLRNEAERLRIARETAMRDAMNDDIARQEREEKLTQTREEKARLERAQGAGIADSLYQMRNVIQAAKDAKERSNDWFATGIGATTAAGFGGTAASDVEALLNTIGSNTAFDRLQKMREESPTGGALGAVSEVELRLLRDSIASLSQSQSDTQFRSNMDKVIAAYTRVAGKLSAADSYYRENGSMDGFTPPSEEELSSFSLDATPSTAAGSGATQTSLELPQEYQDRHAAYLRQNWGNITPDGYAQFRAGLDNEFPEYGSPNLEAYRDIVPAFNQMAAEGQPPEAAGQVPPATRDLSGGEQAINNFVTNPFGTGVTSAINSATFGIPDALAGRRLQAAEELNPKSAFAGDFFGGAVGSALGGGAAALAGAGRFAPVAGDALYGTIYGATSDEDPVAGALLGLGSAVAGDQVGKFAGRAVNSLRLPDMNLSEGQRAITQTVREAGNQDEIAQALMRADELGVPMTLADASPELQSLAGSAVRFSPTTAGTARSVMAQRNQGQLDRLAEAVARDLGPVENIPQRSEALMQQARAQAGPLYDQAYAAPGADMVDLSDLADRPTFEKVLREAYNEVLDEGLDPITLGFRQADDGAISIGGETPSNVIYRGTTGSEERITGGIGEGLLFGAESEDIARLYGDNIEQIGVSPDAKILKNGTPEFRKATGRRGNDLFRSLRNGENYRDAANEAIERARAAGYDAVDLGGENGIAIINQGAFTRNASQPTPSWQSLDYAKRGLDNIIERGIRQGDMPEVRRAQAMKSTLLQRMDEANPAYAEARRAYAGPAQERGFLEQGQQATRTRPDELSVELANLTPEQRQQMQLGFQSETMARAGDVRNNTNPWAQLNTPNTEGRMGALYGEDANIAQLLSQRDLELQLAGNANRLIGNSETQIRNIADEFFKQRTGMGGDVAMGVIETGALGGPWLTVGKGIADRVFKDRREQAAATANRALADDLGPLLLNQSPTGSVDALSQMMAEDEAYRAIAESLTQQGDKWGRRLGTGFTTALTDYLAY